MAESVPEETIACPGHESRAMSRDGRRRAMPSDCINHLSEMSEPCSFHQEMHHRDIELGSENSEICIVAREYKSRKEKERGEISITPERFLHS
ncbi:hypothetical protein DMENIID0001_032570 [Sergentomyia squamirostris]